MFGVIHQT